MVAGGDFEAEALCLPGIWEDCSEALQDDLLIAVPTKDMVLFTRAGNKKSIRKMINRRRKYLKRIKRKVRFLIFSRDVSIITRVQKSMKSVRSII